MGKQSKRNKVKDLQGGVAIKFWSMLCEFDSMASLLYLGEARSPSAEQGQRQGTSVIVKVEGKVAETYRKADQKYFRQHPEKRSYIRYPFPDEEFPDPQPRKVRVIQVAEGTRIREPIW